MFHILFSVVVLIFVLVSFLIYRNNTYLGKIPKPPCNILLGHLLELRNPTEILEKCTEYTLKYGGLLRLYIPPKRPSVLVADHEILQNLLTSEKTLDKSKDYDFLRRWLGNGLITVGAANWKERRRILTPCFGRVSLLKNFIEVFEDQGNVLIEKLSEEMNHSSIDVFPLMKMFTMDVFSETSMGVSTNCQRNENMNYLKSIENICEIVLHRTVSLLKRFDVLFQFTEDYRRQIKALEIINSFFDNIMKSKNKEHFTTDNTDEDDERTPTSKLGFLNLLLKLQKDGFPISMNDIKEEVNTFLFGGHDTTATGLAFILYALARHPNIQEKVLEEQKHIFGDLRKRLTVSYTDLQEMKYLEMVINEALRLYPPIPMIARKLSDDIDIGGITLPKNLNIILFIYGCHHNPKYFPNPKTFIPERFEDDSIRNFPHFSFSGGQRICIGRKFAILQLKSCISKIVRHFKLLPSNPEYNLELIPAITLAAKNGIRISLESRELD